MDFGDDFDGLILVVHHLSRTKTKIEIKDMIYTVEKANLITRQLNKFKDSYAFMVAGQFANIDFWMNEVESTIKAIDEHNIRFAKMYDAQEKWIEEKM